MKFMELIAGLKRLAGNLWWTWNQESQEIFHELSPRGWQNLYHNAVAVLAGSLGLRAARAAAGSRFRANVCARRSSAFDAYLNEKDTWGRTQCARPC